jgi:hypothetical protein
MVEKHEKGNISKFGEQLGIQRSEVAQTSMSAVYRI